MHVVRKSEGGEDEMRKSKREKLNSMWEETQKRVKNKNGPDWALSVLHGVVSSVLSSSVVLCWIQCDWLQLDSGCDSSIGSVGSASASVGECVAWNVLFSRQQASNGAQNSTGRAKAFKILILVDWIVSVCIICCTERCLSLPSVWVDAVSSLVSVSIWCRCKLWPASMCQLLVSQNG